MTVFPPIYDIARLEGHSMLINDVWINVDTLKDFYIDDLNYTITLVYPESRQRIKFTSGIKYCKAVMLISGLMDKAYSDKCND